MANAMEQTNEEKRLLAIFEHAEWLRDSDQPVCLPISGMPKGHQITWRELWHILETARDLRDTVRKLKSTFGGL